MLHRRLKLRMNLKALQSDITNMTGPFPSGAFMSSQAMSVRAAGRRLPVIAALLSAIAPGVGQVYAGRPWRGAALFGALLAIQAAILASAFVMPPSFAAILAFAVVGITVTLGLYIYIIFDAMRLARESGRAV